MKHFNCAQYFLILFLVFSIEYSFGQSKDLKWKMQKFSVSQEQIHLKSPSYKYSISIELELKKERDKAIKRGEKYVLVKNPFIGEEELPFELVEESTFIDTLGYKLVEWHDNYAHYTSYLYYESNTNFYIFQDYNSCAKLQRDIHRIVSMDGKQIPRSKKRELNHNVKKLVKRYKSIPIKFKKTTFFDKIAYKNTEKKAK